MRETEKGGDPLDSLTPLGLVRVHTGRTPTYGRVEVGTGFYTPLTRLARRTEADGLPVRGDGNTTG